MIVYENCDFCNTHSSYLDKSKHENSNYHREKRRIKLKNCRSFATSNVYNELTKKKLGKGVSHQRKMIMRPGKDNKVGMKKKAECVSNPSTPTEEQPPYFNSELRSVGPL